MDSLPPLLPPVDLPAEQALLGHLIANRGTGMIALAFLGPQHFADAIHGLIFNAIERFVAKGLPISATSLRTHFAQTGELADVGGPAYLGHLATALDEKERSAADCARAVHDCWIQRQLCARGPQAGGVA